MAVQIVHKYAADTNSTQSLFTNNRSDEWVTSWRNVLFSVLQENQVWESLHSSTPCSWQTCIHQSIPDPLTESRKLFR